MPTPRRLNAALREELSDAKLLLDAASHNLHALLRATPTQPQDLQQALDNAHLQLSQVLATLERVRGQPR